MEQLDIRVDLTVLVCTFNRAEDLRALLRSVLDQECGPFEYEVLVVDNNSPDHTRAVVDELAPHGNAPLEYRFEARQGKSYALNTGLAVARGEVVAVVDDDQLMPPGYVAELMRAFRDHPEVAFVGGKVLPLWERDPPDWLTRRHWAPIGMSDYGDEVFTVNASRPVCLLTCAFRLADLRAVGGFRQELGVTGNDQIGSTEDAEIQARLWRSGSPGLYLPTLVLQHRAPSRRLTRQYYRRWHRGHGRFRALLRDENAENSRARLFDVPAYMYRQAATDLLRWLGHTLQGNASRAFDYHTRLYFFMGFFSQRLSDYSSPASNSGHLRAR